MDKLILLVGASGAGKTTIAKELEKLGYNIIHSYTTRKPREENEWGHIFIHELREGHSCVRGYNKDGDCAIDAQDGVEGEMIALKVIYDEVYFATKEQYQGKGASIYIVDPDGANQVKENVKDAEVITIFLMADWRNRFDRIKERHFYNTEYPEGISVDGLYNESKRTASIRTQKDKEVFKTCKCDYVVDANRELEEVVKDVIEIIEGEI